VSAVRDRDSILAWVEAWFKGRGSAAPGRDRNFIAEGVIDSFDVIELIESIEMHFNIRFSETDFQDRRFVSIVGLSEIIGEKTERRA
jgi:acyl carrier protein